MSYDLFAEYKAFRFTLEISSSPLLIQDIFWFKVSPRTTPWPAAGPFDAFAAAASVH